MKKGILLSVLTIVFTLSVASFAFAANTTSGAYVTSNTANYPVSDQVPDNNLTVSTFATDDTMFDNGLINANKTGVGVGGQATNQLVDKAVTGQRVHGEYASNTNSCASCHQVHTAAGKNLLFKDDVYNTCTACHDGTLGLLDVFSASTAGTFGGTSDGHASMHLPTGVMQTKAAPGGNKAATDNTQGGGWTNEFDCASCHSPHGSYSDRLLNYNPNQIGSTNMYLADGVTKSGGLKLVGAPIYAGMAAVSAQTADYALLQTTANDPNANVSQEADGTSQVIVLMQKTAKGYARVLTPWINDGSWGGKYTSFTKFYNGNTNLDKTAIEPHLAQAYVKVLNGTTVTKADVSRAVVVKFDFFNTASYKEGQINGLTIPTVDPATYTNTKYGVQISTFCASCHTDYLAHSGSQTGTWSKAFRHSTDSDSYTCLKCHFAHGTDVNVMLDANDQSVKTLTAAGAKYDGDLAGAQGYLMDTNASSALKRYTNMSVCWKCHTGSHAGDMINNVSVGGALNTGVLGSTEFNNVAPSNPNGWVTADSANLPYLK